MTSRERTLSSVARKGYDRIPIKHDGTPEVNKILMEHFGVADHDGLLRCVGDDLRVIGPDYVGPEMRRFPDGSWEGLWGERYQNLSFGTGAYPESIYQPFADVTDVSRLSHFRFPSSDWFDYSTVPARCRTVDDYAIVCGGAGNMDFINGIARCRGLEQVLVDLATEDPVYLALMDQRFQFFYEMHERTLQAAQGRIDITHIGEDLGSQIGSFISPKTFEHLFAPKLKTYFEMVHRYNARTMMHSCGSVRAFIPRLIELGLDILDVVQVAATGMDIRELHQAYGKDLCFAGSMCVQSILPFGTVDDVRREVRLRLALFAEGGLILGPTHQIQVGTPLENILAMYDEAGGLQTAG